MNKTLVFLKVRILKKLFFMAILIGVIYSLKNVAYCISKDFSDMLDIIGIPRYNVYNQQINEDIYKVYNLFVYSSPTSVNVSSQRWKTFPTGKWRYGGGMYKGVGTRGEYSILGRDYSGSLVYNYYFPLDSVPTLSPEKWNYLYVSGASTSWKDKNKYKYIEQIEYMKNANWYFSDIRNGQNNPYNQIEYNINALKVGLSKARLESVATWKSSGTIYINLLSKRGYVGYAVFMVPPMGQNVVLKSNINVASDEYVLKEEEDEIYIPININAYLDNLNKYTKKEHIKNFNLKLYINSKEVLNNSGSKIISMGNEYMLVITRKDFPPTQKHTIEIKLDAYVQTAFSNDGLLKDSQSKKISLVVKEKKIDLITSLDLRELALKNDEWVVSPLAQNIETNLKSSLGFTEAGRYIVIKNMFNDKHNISYEKISNVEAYLNSTKLENIEVIKLDSKSLAVKIKLPNDLANTLYGYKSLRDKYSNYFNIGIKELGTRVKKPYSVTISCKYKNQEYESTMLIDILDDYISNMNLYILNSTKNKEILSLKKWLEN